MRLPEFDSLIHSTMLRGHLFLAIVILAVGGVGGAWSAESKNVQLVFQMCVKATQLKLISKKKEEKKAIKLRNCRLT